MWNGDAAPDAGAPKAFPLKEYANHFLTVDSGALCNGSHEFLQHPLLVSGIKICNDGLFFEDVQDFHKTSFTKPACYNLGRIKP